MTKIWDEARLQQYIKDSIEESLNLDYKAAAALSKSDGKKREITKDVSAMANSDGGIIVYGISEFQDKTRQHLPEKLDPVDRVDFSKEWLEQIINNIRPKIDGLKIYPVDLSSGKNDVAYVVDIPQSHTAHQAMNKRYYKRFNFESVAMDDYEIRDVMGRGQHPKIELEFELEFKEPDSLFIQYNAQSYWYLNIYGHNVGKVYAQYISCTVKVPAILLRSDFAERDLGEIEQSPDGEEYFCIWESNLRVAREASSMIYQPILPQYTRYLGEERIDYDPQTKEADLELHWEVSADNAPLNSGSIHLRDIPMKDVL